MKKLLVILWIAIFGQVASFAQGYWTVERFKDEFGDPIPGMYGQYAENSSIKNSYSHLKISCAINRHGVLVLFIDYYYHTSDWPERRELNAPATLSFKTKDGKIHRFTSNDDDGGRIWFTDENGARDITMLLEKSNFNMVLTVKSYIDGTKSYRYSVNGNTRGLFATLKKMYNL